MTIREFLSQYEGVVQGTKPNQYSARPIVYGCNIDDIGKFNEILKFLRTTNLHTITRTKSGSIGKGPRHRNNRYAWDHQRSHTGSRITVLIDGITYVFKLCNFSSAEKKPPIYPNQAFNIFKNKCLENGVDLEKYKVNNGEEVKKTIEKPLIGMKYKMDINSKALDNVHHIDFHNSYPAGLCNTHPEFRPIIEPIYEQRRNPEYTDINKAILNYTIGWMQSYEPDKHRYAELATLSRDAIADNNKRLRTLATVLMMSGREVIGFNTDGIWYRGPIYHGKGEGDKLGEWHNDHVNCLFRSKSNGAYEFIEDGKVNVVLRGCTRLDIIKNRDEWSWGDIFTITPFGFKYNEIEGVYEYVEI